MAIIRNDNCTWYNLHMCISILLSLHVVYYISLCCGTAMTNNVITSCKNDGRRLITVIITIITIIASVFIRTIPAAAAAVSVSATRRITVVNWNSITLVNSLTGSVYNNNKCMYMYSVYPPESPHSSQRSQTHGHVRPVSTWSPHIRN